VDVARCAVMFLFQYFSSRNQWSSGWQELGDKFKELVEEKLGRHVSAPDAVLSAQSTRLEYDIRRAIVETPNFGKALRVILREDSTFVPFLKGEELYDADAWEDQLRRENTWWTPGRVAVAVVLGLILLCIIGTIVSALS